MQMIPSGPKAVVGMQVVAFIRFDDVDSGGRRYTHAVPGDLGRIIGVHDELTPTVRWDLTGTLCDCAPDEIQLITRPVVRG